MKTTPQAVAAALVAVFAVVLVRTAWVSDDAFITLRVVDNAVHGFGLRWNVAERVQVYTHPLWMLLLLPFYAITREPFFTTLALGMACSLAAVGSIAWRWRREPWTAAAVLVPLIASRAYVDYSTSGLENPLTHLLLVAFVCARFADDRRLLLSSALAAGIALNRPDAILLVAPALGWEAWRRGARRAWREVAIGFLPLIAWTLFAIVYYGIPYPNTALAKLATGIPAGELAVQGLRYLAESMRHDPATLAATAAAGAAAFLWGGTRERLLAAGASLYLAYTVKVGGDFMSGRFLAAPLLTALLAGAPAAAKLRWGRAALAAAALVLSFAGPFPNLLSGPSIATHRSGVLDPSGIADERRFYFAFQGWLNGANDDERPLASATRAARSWRASNAALAVTPNVGVRGYYGGPHVHLVDLNALTDPLLARMPMVARDPSYAGVRRSFGLTGPSPAWRIGHFVRSVPAGYLATVLTGENRIDDPEIRALWDRVAKVTRGPVWSAERLGIVVGWLVGGGRLDRERTVWTPIAWDEAIAARPGDAALRYGRATATLETTAVEAALGLAPDNVEILALAVRARASAGDLAAAVSLARRAVELAPRDPELRSIHAAMLGATGDLQGAIAEYRRAMDGDPVYAAAARVGIGRCLLALGDAASGATWLREAVASDPGNADWRTLLEQAERAVRR
ncbi:MAG TPA: tetratricopeptide repeat protein [Candidatus Polarisedimenticolaceae bacterium]